MNGGQFETFETGVETAAACKPENGVGRLPARVRNFTLLQRRSAEIAQCLSGALGEGWGGGSVLMLLTSVPLPASD